MWAGCAGRATAGAADPGDGDTAGDTKSGGANKFFETADVGGGTCGDNGTIGVAAFAVNEIAVGSADWATAGPRGEVAGGTVTVNVVVEAAGSVKVVANFPDLPFFATAIGVPGPTFAALPRCKMALTKPANEGGSDGSNCELEVAAKVLAEVAEVASKEGAFGNTVNGAAVDHADGGTVSFAADPDAGSAACKDAKLEMESVSIRGGEPPGRMNASSEPMRRIRASRRISWLDDENTWINNASASWVHHGAKENTKDAARFAQCPARISREDRELCGGGKLRRCAAAGGAPD